MRNFFKNKILKTNKGQSMIFALILLAVFTGFIMGIPIMQANRDRRIHAALVKSEVQNVEARVRRLLMDLGNFDGNCDFSKPNTCVLEDAALLALAGTGSDFAPRIPGSKCHPLPNVNCRVIVTAERRTETTKGPNLGDLIDKITIKYEGTEVQIKQIVIDPVVPPIATNMGAMNCPNGLMKSYNANTQVATCVTPILRCVAGHVFVLNNKDGSLTGKCEPLTTSNPPTTYGCDSQKMINNVGMWNDKLRPLNGGVLSITCGDRYNVGDF